MSLAASAPAPASEPRPRYTIRWVLVHDHGEAVRQAAQDFAERVERETKGDVRVKILSRGEYGKHQGKRASPGSLALLQEVASGNIEIAQTYTNSVGRYAPHLHLLGMPYLFRDYAHAETVLDGPIGQELLAELHGTPVRGLAFTYSGGFGFFASNHDLREPKSLRGLRIQTMPGKVSGATAWLLEFENFANPPEAFKPLAQHGVVDGIESVYSCFEGYGDDQYAKVVTDTGHFLLTTMIVINSAFYARLPEAYRTIIEGAALDAARKERRDSLELNASLRRSLERRGVRVIDLTPAERKRYQDVLSAVGASLGLSDRKKNILRRIRGTGVVESKTLSPLAVFRRVFKAHD